MLQSTPHPPQAARSTRRFRLGTTSFVHPSTWIDNAERLSGVVQDVLLAELGA